MVMLGHEATDPPSLAQDDAAPASGAPMSGKAPAGAAPLSSQPMSTGADSLQPPHPEPADFTFRVRICFDHAVERLEFQVNWEQPVPIVGRMKAGGEAERHGVCAGDTIATLNGMETAGLDRSELLPHLQERPLTLGLNRVLRVDPDWPYLELGAFFDRDFPGDLGIDVAWNGLLPVVCAVREGSPACTMGIFVGDAIHSINDHSANPADRSKLQAAMQQRPLALQLWRRPVGVDAKQPWQWEHGRVALGLQHSHA